MSEYIYASNGEPLANERGEILLARACEVVRCKDCREYNTELYKHISCELLGRYVEPDGFCAWGKNERDVQ